MKHVSNEVERALKQVIISQMIADIFRLPNSIPIVENHDFPLPERYAGKIIALSEIPNILALLSPSVGDLCRAH